MGKISDALEKYRKLRSNLVSGKLRSSDYTILLRFDEASGRLEESAALSKEDSASLQRLMTYRLVDSEGRLTPAGISRLQELHGGQKGFKPSSPEASGAPEVRVPQAIPVPKPDQLSDSDWAILMRYDRKSGNLLTYDPETGRLDQNGTAILREPDTIQRLIDAGMIFPGGGRQPFGVPGNLSRSGKTLSLLLFFLAKLSRIILSPAPHGLIGFYPAAKVLPDGHRSPVSIGSDLYRQ